MIIIKLQGGLGNQIFQYAFGESLSSIHNTTVKYDSSWLNYSGPNSHRIVRQFDLGAFNFKVNQAKNSDLKRWIGTKPARQSLTYVTCNLIQSRIFKQFPIIKEPHFQYSESMIQNSTNLYYDGYWQSEKYFLPVKEKIRSELTPRVPLDSETNDLYQEITNQNSLCVNVRRGDFASDKQSNEFHGLLGNEYYSAAVELLFKSEKFDQIYVFSDEPDWCFNFLRLGVPFKTVGHRFAGPKFSHYLKLMSAAKGFVIPNSTFAWWAAWLAQPKPDQIVAPQKWFTDSTIETSDLINSGWKRI